MAKLVPSSLSPMISPSISEEMIISPSISPSHHHRTTGSGGVHAGVLGIRFRPSEMDSLVAAKARPRSASSTAIHLTIPAAKRSYE